MASSNDARDILGLPAQGQGQGQGSKPPPPKRMKTEPKKLDGMQRELYSLLGENTPPIAMTENKFKSRPDWRSAKKITPWQWTEFTHTGREDGLKLNHWVRADNNKDDNNSEYAFAKFSTQIEMPVLKEEDYEKAYKDDNWSFKETKYLYELCREYDLRWLVIHDRYSFPGGPTRSIEDLKARFYDVYRAYFDLRKEKGETLTQADEDLQKQMKYSKESERKRKEHLERLLKRSPAEIAEEEALVIESRKLEAAAERMIQERQELLKLLEPPSGGTNASIEEYQTSVGLQQFTNNLLSDKTKRRKDNEQPPVTVQASGAVLPSNNNKEQNGRSSQPSSASASAASSQAQTQAQSQQSQSQSQSQNTNSNSNTNITPNQSVKQEKKATATPSSGGQPAVHALLQKKLSSREEASLGLSYHEKIQPGVHFRSTKITTYKPVIQTKVAGVLQELGIPPKPVMPTAKVCAKFESIQHSINVLLDTKRAVDKLETDIRVLKEKDKGGDNGDGNNK